MMGNKPLAVEVDFTTFTASRNGDTQNFDLAPLKPCRIVVASESDRHNPLNPAKLKQLTGGNNIYCAFKYRDHFSYRPQFKIWLSSNHPVNVDVDDDAAWARLRVISFPNSHLGQENKALKQVLKQPENLQGVLLWAVQGAQRWYGLTNGLPYPDIVKETTQGHRDERDYVGQFLVETCIDDPDSWISSAKLHTIYRNWCDRMGVTPKLQGMFTTSLKNKGYQTQTKRVRSENGNIQERGICGLRMRTPQDLEGITL